MEKNKTIYRKRLTDYLISMPADVKIYTSTIVKEENSQLFRETFYQIVQERYDELGKFLSCDEELTWIKKYPSDTFEQIHEAILSINGKRIGKVKDFCDGKLKGCFDELFKK